MMVIFKVLAHVWHYFISLLLSVFVPEYIKRVIFIVSAYAILLNISEDDSEEIKRINEQYHLFRNYEALSFPVCVSYKLWKRCNVQKLIDDAKLVEEDASFATFDNKQMRGAIGDDSASSLHLASALAKQGPSWLQYKSYNQRVVDMLWVARQKIERLREESHTHA